MYVERIVKISRDNLTDRRRTPGRLKIRWIDLILDDNRRIAYNKEDEREEETTLWNKMYTINTKRCGAVSIHVEEEMFGQCMRSVESRAIWIAAGFQRYYWSRKPEIARNLTFWSYSYVTPKLAGWTFTSVNGKMDARSAVGWPVLALNGLLRRVIINIYEMRSINQFDES